jgi:phospholipid/cholesterol/gamma-HCH transport system substrate-binding protein
VKHKLSGLLLKIGIFVTVSLLGAFALVAVFAQLRFQAERSYHAIFTSVSGLDTGNFVRIAGVEVGKVQKIAVREDGSVLVTFGTDDSVALTEGTKAVIRYDNLIGGRYLAVEEGAGGLKKLPVGGTIPIERTSPALDLDALIGGFRPLFRALEPDQVNALTGQLISAFQGQGGTIGSVLSQTATLTNTLADRDDLIGQVIVNLNAVLGSFGERTDQFATAVDSLADLLHGLETRKQDLSNGLAYANAAASSISDLLAQARPPLQTTIKEVDRASAAVLGERDYFDDLLNTLPDTYRMLNRQALYGDFFSFYLCDLLLKVNGKGGQPVYIKVAGQDSGRCTPR